MVAFLETILLPALVLGPPRLWRLEGEASRTRSSGSSAQQDLAAVLSWSSVCVSPYRSSSFASTSIWVRLLAAEAP